MNKHHSVLAGSFTASLLTLVMASGCNNVLEFTNDSESFEGLMAAGRTALQEQHYAYAETRFAKAIELSPASSDARFYHSKAAVLASNVDVFEIVQTLTDSENSSSGATDIFGYETSIANGLYRVNRVVIEDLRPIRDGEATEGDFANADVELDLAIGYTLRGILRLRDTNGDGVINGDDLSPDDFGLSEDGDFSLDGLDELPPEDLNDLIDDVGDLLEDGSDLLGDIIGESGVNTDELDDLVDNLGDDLSLYYINTGVPGNPGEGDNDGDGMTDEECLNGIDDDGDGVTDEDSRVLGCP